MALERESQAYTSVHLPRLLAEGKVGKYALVLGDDLIGVYDTFDDAFRAGYNRWLHEEFFVKRIGDAEGARSEHASLAWRMLTPLDQVLLLLPRLSDAELTELLARVQDRLLAAGKTKPEGK